uniref:Uncharacterized protein n=1 Tax=Arundo donax TaxID=35708 RepID=A0A0A8ZLI9_ARUDO
MSLQCQVLELYRHPLGSLLVFLRHNSEGYRGVHASILYGNLHHCCLGDLSSFQPP